MTNKELIQRFKQSLQLVADQIKCNPNQLTRDRWLRHAVDNDLPRLNKKQLNELGGFSNARELYFPSEESKLSPEELEDITKNSILEIYRAYVEEHGITPSIKVLKSKGITSNSINKLFGGRMGLYFAAKEEFPEIFDDLVNDSIFTRDYFKGVQKSVKNKKRFIITAAVSGKEVEENFLNAIQTHNEVEDSMLLILPCEDVASRNSIFDWELDRKLRSSNIVFDDLYLNEKFYLSSIRVSAKQVNPITGLDRIAQAKGSTALASPKQYLKFVANSNTKIPRALMTTGAITKRDYSTDLSMSKRTSYLADFDHVIGAIIVEIADNKLFHFRQIQADDDGSFIDLGWKYNPDGTVTEVEESAAIFGDTHVGSHDLSVDKCLQEIVEYANSTEIVVHDLFDCRFNNHHEQDPVIRAILAREERHTLVGEGEITRDWLTEWRERVDKLTVVKSNHDEALDRYIKEGRWKDDPANLYDSLDLVKAYMDGKDPLRVLIEEQLGYERATDINWLNRDEDYKIYGIENGAHGDKGANGSRGSLPNLEKAYYKATVGHSHTAGIMREVYQVGTSTKLKLHYNTGPSSWTNTMCLQYPNGSRQLVNMIRSKDGRISWRLED